MTLGKYLVKVSNASPVGFAAQSQTNDLAAARWHFQAIVGGGFRARPVWIHRLLLPETTYSWNASFTYGDAFGLPPQAG